MTLTDWRAKHCDTSVGTFSLSPPAQVTYHPVVFLWMCMYTAVMNWTVRHGDISVGIFSLSTILTGNIRSSSLSLHVYLAIMFWRATHSDTSVGISSLPTISTGNIRSSSLSLHTHLAVMYWRAKHSDIHVSILSLSTICTVTLISSLTLDVLDSKGLEQKELQVSSAICSLLINYVLLEQKLMSAFYVYLFTWTQTSSQKPWKAQFCCKWGQKASNPETPPLYK